MIRSLHTIKYRTVIIFALFFSAILSILAFHRPASASTQDFYFKDATFDYYLEKTDSGSNLHVKEVLTAVFPETNQNHGITRIIPYTNQDGTNVTIEDKETLNLLVKRNGQSESIAKIDQEAGYFRVYIGNASSYVHGEQTYILEYDFKNVITAFDANGNLVWGDSPSAYQELYWDTNGTGWGQVFQNLTANLHLPADIAKNLTSGTSCYVGRFGTGNDVNAQGNRNISSRCTVSSDDETTYNVSAANSSLSKSAETIITFEASNLSAGENLTFAVNFAPGTFVVPDPEKSYTLVIILVTEIIVLSIAVFLAIRRYIKVAGSKAAYYKGFFVKPEYAPPKNLTVAESAELGINITKSSFVATLLELAVSRKIELKNSKKKGLLSEKDTWSIIVKDISDITGPQKAVLKILNNGELPENGETVDIEKHRATSALEGIKRSYHTKTVSMLEEKQLFEKDKKGVSIAYFIIPVILFILFFTAVLQIAESTTGSIVVGRSYLPIVMIVLIIVSFIILGFLSTKASTYAKRSIPGLEMSKYFDGLKLYIDMAEKDRIKFLQSVKGADTSTEGIVRLYEKLLPYACIFGAEESWMNELNRYYKEHPEIDHNWYYGSNYLTYSSFRNLYSTTSSTIVSSTSYSSSSSSGGGGGGFSGGGGGGGGGGGW